MNYLTLIIGWFGSLLAMLAAIFAIMMHFVKPLESRLARVETRMDRMDEKFDRKIDSLRGDVDELRKDFWAYIKQNQLTT